MKKIKVACLTILYLSTLNAFASGEESDPIISTFILDQLERRSTQGPDFNALEAQAWIGWDFDKLRLKLEAEFSDDETESAELQLVYSRAVSSYWDVQMGYRKAIYPKPKNDWLVFGFIGLAPYFVDVDTAIFIAESGHYGFRLEAEYELVLSKNQQWVLVPELEINAYSKSDESAGIGSGLSDLELGLRLNYFFNRHLSVYAGINWENKFGKTAGIARAENEDTNDIQYVTGLHGWF